MLKILWMLFLLIWMANCQIESNETEASPTPLDPQDYVVQLKFSYREEKIPEHIINMLNNSLEENNITVGDIVRLSGLDKYNLEQTINLLNHYNISLEKAFSVDSLQFILDFAGMSFLNFYDALTTKLGLSSAATIETLNDLSIDQAKFTGALIFELYDIYEVLRNGSYTEDNVEKALSTVQKTRDEVFIIAKEIVYNEVVKINPAEFMTALGNLGLNRRSSLSLWKALNITTVDVYNVEKFANILRNTITNLNHNLTIAVITEKHQIAIHDLLYGFCHVDTNIIKIETNQDNEIVGYEGFISPKIVKLRLRSDVGQFVKVAEAEDYETVTNCSYITIVEDVVVMEYVEIFNSQTQIIAKKNPDSVYNLGSPLVCTNVLYGLAREQNDTVIVFDTFFEKSVPQNEDTNSSNVLKSNQLLFIICSLIYFLMS